jgi:spermidine dehydrogenase
MRKVDKSKNNDELLGLDQNIDRRDFLNSALIGSGSLLYSMSAPAFLSEKILQSTASLPHQVKDGWYGYGGVGDSKLSHGNTPEILKAAHAVRDGLLNSEKAADVSVSENYDLIIVGAGLSGLGAAQRMVERNPSKKCLILENHPIFGGEAKRNEFNIDGKIIAAPQGSNSFYYNTQFDFDEDRKYIKLLGIPAEGFTYGSMSNDPKKMVFAQEHYDVQLWAEEYISKGHFVDEQSHNVKPQWIKNPWRSRLKDYPVSEKVRKDLLTWKHTTDMPGSDTKTKAWLDNMTYKEYIEKVMGLDEAVTKFADPVIASAGGMGCDVMSAYTAQLLGMYGVALDDPAKPENRHSFPGGNDGFARHFINAVVFNTVEEICELSFS